MPQDDEFLSKRPEGEEIETFTFTREDIKNLSKKVAAQVAQEVIESGLVENAKPIYFHPIVLVGTQGSDTYSLYVELLNNDDTPYATSEAVKNALLEIATAMQDTARIGVAGGYYVAGSSLMFIPSHIDVRYSDSKLYMYGIYENGTRAYIDLTDITFSSIYDGVNKIN